MRDNILSGRWKPGHQLAIETDMAAHGVSRMTMNKVLTQLTREGFLERRRKVGTVVALPRAQSMVMEIADIEREIDGLGLDSSYCLVSRVRRAASAEDLSILQSVGVTEVLAVSAIHSANGKPFCLEGRLINLAAAPGAAEPNFERESPGKWLLRNVP